MAKKTQTANRRRRKVAVRRVVNYYNHGTVNVDARQNNSTSKRHEYTGCTFNGVTEHVNDIIEDDKTPVIETQSSSPVVAESKDKSGMKTSTWLKFGAAILLVGVGIALLTKTKQ